MPWYSGAPRTRAWWHVDELCNKPIMSRDAWHVSLQICMGLGVTVKCMRVWCLQTSSLPENSVRVQAGACVIG